MIYEVEVSEIIHHRVLYRVEADSPFEAAQKAASGDTVKETPVKDEGVMDRHVHADPELVEEEIRCEGS